MRLAEARARVELRGEVTREDAEVWGMVVVGASCAHQFHRMWWS